MGSVTVISDSACDLGPEVADGAGIQIVPLSIRFGETEYVDREQLSNDQFWTLMETASELPSTAAPAPGAFEDAYRKAKENGASGVIVVNLSSRLSATYQSAVKAAEAVAGEIDVRVIDSRTCTVAQGTLCLEAARLANEGESLDEIAEAIESMVARIRLVGTLDTIENLKKGGRIGAAGAFFASLLSVKPVITIEDGEVKPLSRQRTRKRSIDHLVSLVAEAGRVERISVAHSSAPDVDELISKLAATADADIPVSGIGPVIGTHGGPRLLAVSFLTAS